MVRFQWKNEARWGIVEDERIFAIDGDIYSEFGSGKELCPLQDVRILAPAEPTVMVACALNYIDHIRAMNKVAPKEPKLFFKPPNTVIAHLDKVHFPEASKDYRFEAELCVVLKRRARNIAEEHAMDYVLGYTCGNDFAAFDFLEQDQNVTRARGFDTSGALGPFLVTGIDPHNLAIKGRVNGEVKQDSTSGLMIHNVPKLLSHISRFMTLQPGDVVWTGTPKGGACPVKVGDVTEVEIEGIGTLRNEIMAPQ